MAKQSLNGVLQQLRKMAAVQTCHGLSDRELLERFVGGKDEAAFTVLIERHGPMVVGVCQRALPNFHDAEDACQATFLVLARKAGSVRKKTSLSSWLHGVACRVAARLTRDHARRKSREHGVDAPAPKDPAAEVSWREVQAILDEELEQLPQRYRAPVILCYLECMTREDAAKQLGLSPGSLHGRLERGRDLLRERLTKRGLTLSAVMSAAALGESVAQAALAPTLVVSSTKAAMLLAAGQPLTEGVVATHVLTLTQEVLKTMFLTKLKLGTAAVLCACLFAALIGGSFTSPGIAQDAFYPPAKALVIQPAKTESDADFIRRISKDLRGTDPTPTEMHFFVASKDAGRRQKLIDLFIQERQAKKATDGKVVWKASRFIVDVQKDNEDMELLQGTWTLVEAHMHGKKVAAKDLPTKDFSYRSEKLAIAGETIVRHLNGTAAARGEFELDTTKKPKEITISWLIPWRAIYKLEGDTLTICFNQNANLPRPDEFRTLADSERVLFVYERAKKEKTSSGPAGSEKAIEKAIPSATPAEKKDDINDGDAISVPVAYRDLMLVVVSAKGASAVTFKEEDDDDESVSYQFRYESRDRKEKYEGRGKVAGGIQTIKAGGVTLLWSRAKRGHGWIYYNPDKTAVHLAHAQDYADRVERGFGNQTPIPKLDLRRFMK